MFYEQKIKSAVELAVSEGSDGRDLVAIRSAVTKRLYAEENVVVRAQVDAEREAIYAKDMEEHNEARNQIASEGAKGCVLLSLHSLAILLTCK